MVLADNGDFVDATTYQPYGKMVPVITGTESVRERFTGKELDKEGAVYDGSGVQIAAGMGLQYFGARYYDAETGVWTSGDPADQFWNSYSYVGGNSINLIDPNGQSGEPVYDFGRDIVYGEVPSSGACGANAAFVGINFFFSLYNLYQVINQAQQIQNVNAANSALNEAMASRQTEIGNRYYETPLFNMASDGVDKAASSSGTPTLYQLYGEATAITPFEWVNNVREGGKWDFKAHFGPSYEPYGNLAYGVTGTAQGIPAGVLLRAAGVVQKLTGTSDPIFGQPWGASPFGDDPKDQSQILQGIQWANSQRSFYPNAPFAPDATRTR